MMRVVCAAQVLLALMLLAVSARAEPVRVASKNFTESVVLGELACQLIRHGGDACEHRRGLGGTVRSRTPERRLRVGRRRVRPVSVRHGFPHLGADRCSRTRRSVASGYGFEPKRASRVGRRCGVNGSASQRSAGD